MNDLTERLAAAVRTLDVAQRMEADAWVRGSGLTRQQAFTLGYIEDHQSRGVIARELSETFGTTPASVTSLLQGLEDRGLIVRSPSPDDSRTKLLTVTPEGSRLVEGFDEEMQAARARLFSPLSLDEQEHLLRLLTRLTDTVHLPEPRQQQPV